MSVLVMWAAAPPKSHFNIPLSLFWTLWLGFLGLVVLMLLAKARAARKRREGLQQFGMESGFTFSEKADEALAERLAQIKSSGGSLVGNPRFSNVLQGSAAGGEAIIADRTVGSGKSQSTSTIIA